MNDEEVIFSITDKNLDSGLRGVPVGTCQTSFVDPYEGCLLYTSPSPRDLSTSRMPSSA